MKLPRAILADDHTLVAEALHGLIAAQFDVVATVADGHALLASALALKPDVIVVDVAMPLLNGLEACRQLKQKMPAVKLVFLTMNEDPEQHPRLLGECRSPSFAIPRARATPDP